LTTSLQELHDVIQRTMAAWLCCRAQEGWTGHPEPELPKRHPILWVGRKSRRGSCRCMTSMYSCVQWSFALTYSTKSTLVKPTKGREKVVIGELDPNNGVSVDLIEVPRMNKA